MPTAFTGDANTPQEQGGGMGGNVLPFSDLLVGKEFTLRYDNEGPAWNYRILDLYNLQWRKDAQSRHRLTPGPAEWIAAASGS